MKTKRIFLYLLFFAAGLVASWLLPNPVKNNRTNMSRLLHNNIPAPCTRKYAKTDQGNVRCVAWI